MTADLIAWLRAQLDEDELVAHRMIAAPAQLGVECDAASLAAVGAHLACWSPKRALAEVEAKRRILDLHDSDGGHECQAPKDGWGERIDYVRECLTLRLLALPYADRPGYRNEWWP